MMQWRGRGRDVPDSVFLVQWPLLPYSHDRRGYYYMCALCRCFRVPMEVIEDVLVENLLYGCHNYCKRDIPQ